MKLLKYLFAEWGHNKKFVLFFIFNLCIGLSGFIALDGFKSSIDYTMKLRSKAVLGADLMLSARRPLDDKETRFVLGELPKGTQEAEVIELYSMVQFPNDITRLVKIKAVSAGYPFYGGLQTATKSQLDSDLSTLMVEDNHVWIFSELVAQGNLKIGSVLKIGESEFSVKEVIVDDSTSGMGASFAPTIYISMDNLKKTNLIRKGSVAWHSRLYRLPEDTTDQVDLLKDKIFQRLPSQDAQLKTHEEASEQMSRLLQSLNDYLGLAAVVALFLAAVGTGFLYRSYFQRKVREIAILISLGMTRNQAGTFYLVQIVFLGMISACFALVISFLLIPIFQNLTTEFLPFQFEFILTAKTIVVSVLVGVIGSLCICVPFLGQLKNISPVVLLSETRPLNLGKPLRFLLYCLPGVAFFWLLSVWQASSLQTGSVFVMAFLTAGGLLIVVSFLILKVIERIPVHPQYLALQWAFRDMSRERLTSISCFLALGLGATLLNLVPQVQASLEQELNSPESSRLPSLFMFDIQEDQLMTVKSIFKKHKVELTQVSPMIRSRLISVNNKSFDKGKGAGQGMSREEEREMRFRNRGFNLSYRDGLSESETLYAGEPMLGTFEESAGGSPQISMEKRFAERLKLKIGDLLKFEIEGVPVEGRIANFRTVRWTSFQPNFFIQFQPGVLEMAPKTFIATSQSVSEEEKVALQKDLVSQAPNVSIIDVTRLVEKISEIIRQMSLALQTMALLCLFSGFVVIFSILSHQMEKKRWQIGLKKILGAKYSSIRNHIYIQYLILSLSSAIFGVVLSIAFSYLLSRILFESVWVFSLKIPFLSLLLICVVTLLVIYFSSRRYLNQSAKSLIGS